VDKYKHLRWCSNRRGPVSVLAASVLLTQVPAYAQAAETEDLEEVIVTGIRAGLRSSMEVKRESLQVVDAISAEDIGDFPDKNVGEALQRVTGVQISRQDGEGRGVSIRGADPGLNRVEINGSSALSLTVGGGRDVDFRDIPVEFISRLEVVKSATPDMTEGGVGGTVRVITRRPFDSDEPYLAGSVQGVYSDLADAYDPKVALIGSRTFLDETLGVLLSASWEERNLDSHNARTTGWLRRAPTATGPGSTPGRGTDVNADGTLDWIPEIPRYIIDRRDTDRTAFNGIVEWRPNEDFTLFAEGTYAEGHEEVSSMLMQLGGATGLIDYSASTVGPDNTVDHLEIVSAPGFPIDLAYRNINGSLTREQYTTALGAKWSVGSFNLDARVTYASADVQNDEENSTATIFGVPRAIIDYTGGEGAPNISFPGIDTTTGQLVNNLASVFNPRTNTQEEIGGKFDVEYLPESSWLTSVKTGVDLRTLTMDSILFQRTIEITSRTPTPTSAGSRTTVAVPQATIESIVDEFSGVNDVDFFDTGDLGFGSGIRAWNDNGDDTYNATIEASGLTLDPHSANVNPGTNGTFQAYLDTWEVEEKTKAAFVQASFNFEDFVVPVSGTLGVRYVDTDTLSTGFNRVVHGPGPNDISFPRGARAGGYEKWLPSLNLRFDLTDQLVGRMTAGRVMARPSPSQLALRRSLDTAVSRTGSRGNPDLQPFEADQYDLGLEWYFLEDSYVSATLFRKEISSFIINTTSNEDPNGAPCDFDMDLTCHRITLPINGTDKVTIDGIEAGAQLALSFLPSPFDGFGVLANLTLQDDQGFKGRDLVTNESLPFPGLSDMSYNFSVYFENRRLNARASYNWREKWLSTPTGRGGLPEFDEEYGTLDASFGYNITPDVTFFLEGINLLDEQRIQYNSPFRRIGNETFGSRYFAGIRAKF
jgi:iron complex outermembrane recepter protein